MTKNIELETSFSYSLRELEKFVSENFSHVSAEEFFRERSISIDDYKSIHLSRAYVWLDSDAEKLRQTELRLAEEAMTKACKYVTNLDYCSNCIVARGWRLR